MKFLLFLVFLLAPRVLFAQGESVEPTMMGYVAVLFNSGVVLVLVQLLKWRVLPWLRATAPYLIPILAMAVGMATAWIFALTGIDITPIGDILGAGIVSGALASSGFVVLKEVDNRLKKRRA